MKAKKTILFVAGMTIIAVAVLIGHAAYNSEDYALASLMCALVVFEVWAMWWTFKSENQVAGLQKWVVIVRAAKAGEFGGLVSMKSVRKGDEWRVTEADSAAGAVCEVLGAGEVPVVWRKWEDLSLLRRMQLTVRDFVRGFYV